MISSVLSFAARGPGFKDHPLDIQPTLYFGLGPPDVIPLLVGQELNLVVKCWPLRPVVWGSNTSPESLRLLFTLG